LALGETVRKEERENTSGGPPSKTRLSPLQRHTERGSPKATKPTPQVGCETSGNRARPGGPCEGPCFANPQQVRISPFTAHKKTWKANQHSKSSISGDRIRTFDLRVMRADPACLLMQTNTVTRFNTEAYEPLAFCNVPHLSHVCKPVGYKFSPLRRALNRKVVADPKLAGFTANFPLSFVFGSLLKQARSKTAAKNTLQGLANTISVSCPAAPCLLRLLRLHPQ
jgi:hypothetical protein